MYGRRASLPAEIAMITSGKERTENTNLEDYTVKLNDALESSRKVARARAEEVGVKMSVRYDPSHKYIEFRKGDLVLVYCQYRHL